MPKIHVLPDILASQVAAGEVVERPASVVKELVENSLDANASEIEVSISQGGIHLIKIRDNGTGMNREDALLSLERHATSKLRNAKDLMAISTLGFRGEAIPSIASVSRFRLLTCEHNHHIGTEIRISGGKITSVQEAASPPGTTFEIENLFFNVPARRKFLRAESTEAAHIDQQLRLHALAAPHVRFTFLKDKSLTFDLPPCSNHTDRIRQLLGDHTRHQLQEITPHESKGFRIFGAILPPAHARKGRRHQSIFLNGRPIEDPLISRAIRDGFHQTIPDGLHPAAWLWIEMSPYQVDVNVHPAKKEVRFQHPHEVRQAVTNALLATSRPSTNTLQNLPNHIPQNPLAKNPLPPNHTNHTPHEKSHTSHPTNPSNTTNSKTNPSNPNTPPPTHTHTAKNPFLQPHQIQLLPNPPSKNTPPLRFLSLILQRYAILESPDSLVLLDPRAAHERILYEELLHEKSHGITSQPLLVPEILELDPRDHELLLREKHNFHLCGLDLDSFGPQTIQISSIPTCLQHLKTHNWLHDWIHEILHANAPQGRFLFERLTKTLAKRAARTTQPHPQEIPTLLERLFTCDLPYCTPDGRPTLSELSLPELQKRFGQK